MRTARALPAFIGLSCRQSARTLGIDRKTLGRKLETWRAQGDPAT